VSNIKHTPGPWSVYDHFGHPEIFSDSFSVIVYYQSEIDTIVDDDSGVHGMNDNEMLTNIHLIAAAPDLLEALQELYSSPLPDSGCMDRSSFGIYLSNYNAALRKAKEAITKATGKESL